MGERALKRVYIYADTGKKETESKAEGDTANITGNEAENKTENEANKLIRRLSADGIQGELFFAAPSVAETEEIPFITDSAETEGILFITDSAETAERLAAGGCPVLGCLTEKNRQASFSGVRFLIEGMAELDADYLEKVYRRLNQLPWQIVTTPRCIIRETTEQDVDAFYRIYEKPAITRYMENLFAEREEEICYTRQYRENIYEFYGFGIWTVLLKETGEVIGRAGLTMREGFEEPELGFVIDVPWQRQGLAGEVCRAILDYGRKELLFTRVQALTEPENAASIALLRSLGFLPVSEYTEKNIRYLRFVKELL